MEPSQPVVSQAPITPPPSPTVPKAAKIISVLLFIWSLIPASGALLGSIMFLIINQGASSFGGLPFSFFKYVPDLLPIPIFSTLLFPLLFYPALKIRDGSSKSLKITVASVVIFVLLSITLQGYTVTRILNIYKQYDLTKEVTLNP